MRSNLIDLVNEHPVALCLEHRLFSLNSGRRYVDAQARIYQDRKEPFD